MEHHPTIIERAYEIARSGDCMSLDDLARQLRIERYESVDAHISGAAIRRDLRQISQQARRHDPR